MDLLVGGILSSTGALIGGAGVWARNNARRLADVERVSAAELLDEDKAPPRRRRVVALTGVAAAPAPLTCELLEGDAAAQQGAVLTSFKEELHALYQLPNGRRWVREAHTLRATSREAPGWGVGVAAAAAATSSSSPSSSSSSPPPPPIIPVLAASTSRSLPLALAPVAESHTTGNPGSSLFQTFLGRPSQVGTRRVECALVVGTPLTVVGEVVAEEEGGGGGGPGTGRRTRRFSRSFTIRPPPPASGLPYLITTRPLDTIVAEAAAAAAAAVRVGGTTAAAGVAVALLGRCVRAVRRRLVARRAAAARARVADARARAAAARAAAAGACGGDGDGGGDDGDDPLSTCVVCLDAPAEWCYTGCGHLCACEHCAGRAGARCPVCRARGRALKVFRP